MILLTGATGLLGAHVLCVGLERGKRIRAVTRSPSARSFLATVTSGVEIVTCDLTGDLPGTLFDEITTVIHAAALASPFAADEAAMMALNVEATRRLFALAKERDVRWVQISSVAALTRDTTYARTKRLADEALEPHGVLTIHPTFMLGPWDARPSSAAIFLALRMGRLRHYVECVKNVVAAADVATGIFDALARNVTGHYLLGGIDLPMSAFLRAAADAVGIEELTAVREPEGLAEKELAIIRELCVPSPTSSAKAAEDFGYVPRHVSIEALIAETVTYLQAHRLLPRARR